MVDSRAKGQRGEYQVRDLFRKATGLDWERVPGSGGFGKQHLLKGDIYVPNTNTVHCVEIKCYAEDAINSNLLNDSISQLEKWWAQTVREAKELDKEPVLVFKKDRGKWIVAQQTPITGADKVKYMVGFQIEPLTQPIGMMLLEEWLKIPRKYVK